MYKDRSGKTFKVGQIVRVSDDSSEHWNTQPGLGRVEKLTGSPYMPLLVGVRWLNWPHGHDLEEEVRMPMKHGMGGWWCMPHGLDILSLEEATLWLLAK